MEWTKLDENNPPIESGNYAFYNTNEQDNNDMVYTCYLYGKESLSSVALNQVGWIPTHYVYLEPIPLTSNPSNSSSLSNEDCKIRAKVTTEILFENRDLFFRYLRSDKESQITGFADELREAYHSGKPYIFETVRQEYGSVVTSNIIVTKES